MKTTEKAKIELSRLGGIVKIIFLILGITLNIAYLCNYKTINGYIEMHWNRHAPLSREDRAKNNCYLYDNCDEWDIISGKALRIAKKDCEDGDCENYYDLTGGNNE